MQQQQQSQQQRQQQVRQQFDDLHEAIDDWDEAPDTLRDDFQQMVEGGKIHITGLACCSTWPTRTTARRSLPRW